MGGTDGDTKKKRKRKTRSERNQVLYCPTVQKKNQRIVSKRRDNMPRVSNVNTLASAKTSCAPSVLCQGKSRGAITQGRLTRGLTLFKFSKSSDCITRGSAPLTACVQKKVEENLKQALKPPEIQDTVSLNSLPDSNNFKEIETSMIASETRCETRTANPCTKSDKLIQTTFPEPSAVKASVGGSGSQSRHLVNASDSSMSGVSDNELEEVLPVNEIACKIMQCLKPKFNKLDSKRDLKFELLDSLQKQLQKSSCQVSIPQQEPTQLAHGSEGGNNSPEESSLNAVLSKPHTNAPSIPTYRTVPLPQSQECYTLPTAPLYQHDTMEQQSNRGSQLYNRSPMLLLKSNPFSDDQEMRSSDDYSLPYCTIIREAQAVVAQNPFPGILGDSGGFDPVTSARDFNMQTDADLREEEEEEETQDSIPIKLNFQVKEGEEDSEEGEQDSGLSIVQYNAFMASAKSLREQLKIQEQQKQCAQPFGKKQHALAALPVVQAVHTSGSVPRRTRSSKYHHNHHHGLVGGGGGGGQGHKGRRPCLLAPDLNDFSSCSSKDTLELSRHQLKKALDSSFPATRRTTRSSCLLQRDENWCDVNLFTGSLIRHHDNKELFAPPTSHQGQQPFQFEALLFHQSDLQDQARNFLDTLDLNPSKNQPVPLNTTTDRPPPSPSPLASLHRPHLPFPAATAPPGFGI